MTAPSSRKIIITWDPPPLDDINGIIQHYLVNVSVTNTKESFQNITNKTTLLLSGAHPHYTYSISIAAVTVGSGPFTSSYNVTTPQDGLSNQFITAYQVMLFFFLIAPSGSPRNLNASVLNSTAVYLVWNPPLLHEQNGVIKKYIVSVYEVISDLSTEVDTYSTYIVIGDLHPHYQYQMSVSAYTVAPGPDSLVLITTEEDGMKRYYYCTCNYRFFNVSLSI